MLLFYKEGIRVILGIIQIIDLILSFIQMMCQDKAEKRSLTMKVKFFGHRIANKKQ